MKAIDDLAYQMIDEVEGARNYAEKYIESKAIGDSQLMSRFYEMAQDELKHAEYIYDKMVKEIEKIDAVVSMPSKSVDEWNRHKSKYIECAAWVKYILSL